MTIQAQSADGVIHEFPDGTNPAVIDGAMKAYATQKGGKPNGIVDAAKSYISGLSDSVGGIVDQITHGRGTPLGILQPALVVGNALSNRITGANVTAPRIPSFQDVAAAHAYTPQTTGGEIARTAGQMTPAAMAPGNAFARAASVAGPTIGAEAGGRIANAFGASPAVVQGARTAGALFGGAASSLRMTPRAEAGSEDAVANVFASRAGADPQAMAQQADAMRAQGVEPTLLDVTGQKGLRLARAVGVTNDNAGETLQGNAQAISSTTKPAVIARTRTLPGGGGTASKLAADLADARSTEAQTTYAEPYAAPVELKDPNVIQALRDREGASAIERAITAARARMDYKAVADLQQLKATAAGPTGDGQVWPTTGRALDRVQIAFGNKGATLAQNGANDIASGMFKRQDIINGALNDVEGLKDARAAFGAKSQAIDILTKPGARKDPFSTDPADYGSWVDSLSPEARHANQVAIRQDILDTLGGQRAGTVGSIDELATSQYAKQNLASALGPEEAANYLGNLSARLKQRGNAAFVSPNGGSRTAVLQNDMGNALGKVADAASLAHSVATGNVFGLAAKTAAWLKTRGISDADAQALASASIDPAKLDGVIASISRMKDPATARGFVNSRGGLLGTVRDAAANQKRLAQARQ